nr:unnamed protein product [Digitaria exilis]
MIEGHGDVSFTFPILPLADDEPRFPSGDTSPPWLLPSLFLVPTPAASERSRMLPLVARSGEGAFRRNSRLRLPPSGPVAFSSEVNGSLLRPLLDDADGDGGEEALSRWSAAGPPSGLGLLAALLRRLFIPRRLPSARNLDAVQGGRKTKTSQEPKIGERPTGNESAHGRICVSRRREAWPLPPVEGAKGPEEEEENEGARM